ncbi:DUF4339 domain-containing protein [Singulisphaera rosea]
MAAEWYFKRMGTEHGPLEASELVRHAVDGKIGPDTQVRKGGGAWVAAAQVPGLLDRLPQGRPSTATRIFCIAWSNLYFSR